MNPFAPMILKEANGVIPFVSFIIISKERAG